MLGIYTAHRYSLERRVGLGFNFPNSLEWVSI